MSVTDEWKHVYLDVPATVFWLAIVAIACFFEPTVFHINMFML